MLTDGVAVVNSLLRVQPTQDASRNTPEIRVGLRSRLRADTVVNIRGVLPHPESSNEGRLCRCGGMADTADSKSAA